MFNLSKKHVHKRIFNVGDATVNVNYRVLFPNSSSENNFHHKDNNYILFFPGWSLNADSISSNIIGQAFSDQGHKKVIIVDTKPDQIVDNSLYKESIAIGNLIDKFKPQKIILAGYSEGGIKAINLATILQQNKNLIIEGVVLMEPMGLYHQGSKILFVIKFVKDTFWDTPITIGKKLLLKKDSGNAKSNLLVGADVLYGMGREIGRTKKDYPERMRSQVEEMFYKSPRLNKIEVPVIIIQGEKDPVSNPQKIIPQIKKMGGKARTEQISMHEDIETIQLNRKLLNQQRENYLKTYIFTKSPYVRLLIGSKNTPHHVMPFGDVARVVKASLYYLKKAKAN